MDRFDPVYLKISDAALEEMVANEGFVPYTYDDKDPKSAANKTFITEANVREVDGRLTGPWGGTLTKGFGHTRTAKPGDRVTREEALSLLRSDAREAVSCVHRYVRTPLTQGEFDGIADLFYNVGPGALPNERHPNGKDGIACLGKSGGGRPSTLLTKLNDGDYDAAAECFTQWRNKGSIWEWGLLKRRIRFMLVFMNLPTTRAMNALPDVMPATDEARYALVQKCIRLAREEKTDNDAMHTPAADLIKANTTTTIIVDKLPGVPTEAPDVVFADALPSPPAPKPAGAPTPAAAREVGVPPPPSPPPPPVAPPPAPPPKATTPAPPVATAPAPAPTPPADVTPKNPAASGTLWGGLFVTLAPTFEELGNTLLKLGVSMGPQILTLGIVMIVLGRIGAVQPLSVSAPIRSPK